MKDRTLGALEAAAKFDHHHSEGVITREQNFSVIFKHFYEKPTIALGAEEVWCYTDRISYQAGDMVSFHVSSGKPECFLQIVRDGAEPELVHEVKLSGLSLVPTPEDCYASGCGWPAIHSWTIPEGTRSGFYKVICRIPGRWRDVVQHHFFAVREMEPSARAPLLFLCSTATWCAYNDWGGANAYEGIDGPNGDRFSPRLSYQRPFARGLVWLPEGAPRFSSDEKYLPGAAPRYPSFEYGLAHGFAKYYAAAGWAQFERHFAVWADNNSYHYDVATQSDLDSIPGFLDGYRAVVIVGHDEYWSGAMRDSMDAYIENGGKVARFAGNFVWQIRLENDGATQVCYKWAARDEDPVRTSDPTKLTTVWSSATLNRPGGTTFGLSGTSGGYVRVGATTPRWPGGYIVYKPRHWALQGTDLYYGDMFGQEAKIFSYEVDGADYEIRSGQPFATGEDGAPTDMEIIAMGPAINYEPNRNIDGAVYFLAYADAAERTFLKCGETTEAAFETGGTGSGMMVSFRRGKGEVFNAGSCEWVRGLKEKEPFTEKITRNVLDRFLATEPDT
ncbi:MAG: hypothetical protein J0H18_06475 [Rhizobiales bacterium]|nr:hypothetical protein [Hyphomicrobiales bacterium]